MPNKKSASGAKNTRKPTIKSGASTTTKVTTVKAVEAGSRNRSVFAMARPWTNRGNTLLRMPVTSAALAEFIGTFLLAVTVLIVQNQPFYLFFAFVAVFMLVGRLSGAHVNPAVTVGAWVTRRIDWIRAVSYIIAQVLAAMLALVVMNAFLKQAAAPNAEMGQTAQQLFSVSAITGGKEWAIFAAELIGAMVLGFAYASVLRPGVRDKVAGALTVGGGAFIALAFASTAAAYVSASTVLNPAVALTLNALSPDNAWTLVVYIVASVIGAVLGFFLYDLLRDSEPVVE